MTSWNPSYNWTHTEFANVMHTSFVVEKREFIHLDVEHSDRKNIDDIIRWAKAMGYNASEKNMDTIIVCK